MVYSLITLQVGYLFAGPSLLIPACSPAHTISCLPAPPCSSSSFCFSGPQRTPDSARLQPPHRESPETCPVLQCCRPQSRQRGQQEALLSSSVPQASEAAAQPAGRTRLHDDAAAVLQHLQLLVHGVPHGQQVGRLLIVQLQEGALDRVLRLVGVQDGEDLVDGAGDDSCRVGQVGALAAVP